MYAILRILGGYNTTLGWTLMKFNSDVPLDNFNDKRAFTDAKVIATKGDCYITNYEIKHPRKKPTFIFHSITEFGGRTLFQAKYSVFEIENYLTVDDDDAAKLAFEVYDG